MKDRLCRYIGEPQGWAPIDDDSAVFPEQTLRIECLKLASDAFRVGYQSPEEIVVRAKAYEAFVQGYTAGATGSLPKHGEILAS